MSNTYSSLIHLNFSVAVNWEHLKGVDRNKHWPNVSLTIVKKTKCSPRSDLQVPKIQVLKHCDTKTIMAKDT